MIRSIGQSKGRIADAFVKQNYHKAIQVINFSLRGISGLKYRIRSIFRVILGWLNLPPISSLETFNIRLYFIYLASHYPFDSQFFFLQKPKFLKAISWYEFYFFSQRTSICILITLIVHFSVIVLEAINNKQWCIALSKRTTKVDCTETRQNGRRYGWGVDV